jgi:glutamine synthetase type III
MKRIISVVMLIAVLMGAFSVCAFADAEADIVAKAKEVCPDGYEAEYIPALENILAQVEVTEEQAAIVIAAMENSKAIVNSGKGTSLSDYTAAEKDQVLADLKTACDAIGVGYTIVEKAEISTVTFFLKANNAEVLGEVTVGEKEVEGTGIVAMEPATMLLVAAVALVALAGAAFVCQKDRA